MTLKEVHQDLFTVPKEYYLAHCISSDYALGAGIAKKFDEVYDMRFKLKRDYPTDEKSKWKNIGKALLVDNVFNLVTKEYCFQKPTYNSLRFALCDMRNQLNDLKITKLAMPLIGCGLDQLNWNTVKSIIEDIFKNTDIEILICRL